MVYFRLREFTGTLSALILASVSCGPFAVAEEWIGFPKGFKWCVSTAGHQFEGNNNHSDWWDWEEKGKAEQGSRSGLTADHWNRVDEDIQLMKRIGVNAYRFSIEWARIEPQEGVFDESAIEHYRNEVNALVQAEITPIITLQHFTFPLWVRDRGGWEWDGVEEAFAKFTERVYQRIAPDVRYWVTVNEPMNYTLGGYYEGVVPPGEKRAIQGIVPVIRGLLKSHARAYRVLHRLADEQGKTVQVGMALQLRRMSPWNWWNPLDRIMASVADQTFNWTVPDAMKSGRYYMGIPTFLSVDEELADLANTQDYVGINYYGGDQIEFSWKKGMIIHNWDPTASAEYVSENQENPFYTMVMEASRRYPGKPILILENGSSGDDQSRVKLIKHALVALHKAIRDGAQVQSYCHWTLMDDYEWGSFNVPMGLYETDFKTLERKPRVSAELFRLISEKNGFSF